MRDISVSAVIPAYNERAAIAAVVAGVRQALQAGVREHEILVVDDGSDDGTSEAAREAGARVIRHPVNRGYGHSLRDGIAAARMDWVLMIDADGSYPASEIAKLVEHAPDFDLVIGMRTGVYFWGSPMQALLRSVYLSIAGFIVGEDVPDANSGLRLVRRHLAAEPGPVQCLGFSYTTTMTLSFRSAGRFIKYVPIEFHARVGKSKVRPLRDILRTLQLMTQVMLAFNPLKLFVVLMGLPALLALACLGAWLAGGGGHALVAATLWGLGALACLIAGCVLDALRYGRR